MTNPLINLIAVLAIVASAHAAGASEFDAKLGDLAAHEISVCADNPVVLAAIRAQNLVTQTYTDAEIASLDEDWRSEIGTPAQPTIDPILDNAASEFLRGKRDDSGGLFTEIFIMDSRGLNVAASDVTSDYWQGDEGKWTSSFNEGNGKVFIGPLERDASTNKTQVQISAPIISNDSTIGVLVMGVSVDYLSAQQ